MKQDEIYPRKSDYVDYPRNIEKDVQLLKTQFTDFLLIPEYKELYSDDYQFKITEKSYSNLMEGKHRPGHFDGVLTVVIKLLIGIAPSKSYFGEKDFQQYCLIRDMAKSFLIVALDLNFSIQDILIELFNS